MYFQKYHFNIYEFGIIGKFVNSSVRKCTNINFLKSRHHVPFVVLGHKCSIFKLPESGIENLKLKLPFKHLSQIFIIITGGYGVKTDLVNLIFPKCGLVLWNIACSYSHSEPYLCILCYLLETANLAMVFLYILCCLLKTANSPPPKLLTLFAYLSSE